MYHFHEICKSFLMPVQRLQNAKKVNLAFYIIEIETNFFLLLSFKFINITPY